MFDNTSDALAYILTLFTVANLNRFIGAVTAERTAIHHRMVGHAGQPGTSPLSDEWAKLAAQYDMLAAMTTAGYAELKRREDEDRERIDLPDELTHVPMVCTLCLKPVFYIGGDPARGHVGGTWHHIDPDSPHTGSIVRAMVATPDV